MNAADAGKILMVSHLLEYAEDTTGSAEPVQAIGAVRTASMHRALPLAQSRPPKAT
jgi:hypothetical protein